MCLILADGSGQPGGGLQVLQVIEGLVYSKTKRQAHILVDVMVENKGDGLSSMLLLHPGLVSRVPTGFSLVYGELSTGQLDSEPARPELVLRRLYSHRVRVANEDDTPLFHERKNCFLLNDRGPSRIDHWFVPDIQPRTPFPAEATTNQTPIFTCFEASKLARGVSWFRLELKLEGSSYAQFIGDHSRFWVDGPSHVRDQIESEIATRGDRIFPQTSDFFRQYYTRDRVLEPVAYDIVVFRPGTLGVDTTVVCHPASADVYEHTAHGETRLAHLFVTRSPEFWIDLQFEDAIGLKAAQPKQPGLQQPA
jgi:hypothetical protein